MLIYCYSLRLIINETIDQVNVSRQTIITFNQRLRRVFVEKYDSVKKSKVGGELCVVEVDEAHLYTNKKNIGRRIVGESYWVIAGICRIHKSIFFQITTKRDSEFIRNFIKNNIVENTIIITDSWKGYLNLKNLGYIHKKVNHKEEFVSKEDCEVHTNNIERLWRDLRENIPFNLKYDVLEQHIKEYMLGRIFQARTPSQRMKMLVDCINNKKVDFYKPFSFIFYFLYKI